VSSKGHSLKEVRGGQLYAQNPAVMLMTTRKEENVGTVDKLSALEELKILGLLLRR
jgi:hypothetical protein